MTCGVYAIRNIRNGKLYIGSSWNVEQRLQTHLKLLNSGKHGNTHLQNAWNSYGENSFRFALLGECTQERLAAEEQRLIDLLRPEYNVVLLVTRKENAEELVKKDAVSSGFLSAIRSGLTAIRSTQLYGRAKDRMIAEKHRPRYGIRRSKDYRGLVLVSPSGREYHNVGNMTEFARRHNITSSLSNMLNGKTRTCNGWTHYWEGDK